MTPLPKNGLSPLAIVCCLLTTHNAVNSLLLSPLNTLRCSFWDKDECSEEEDWICNWYAMSHFHVSLLLAGMLYVSAGDGDLEVSISYVSISVILMHCTSGLFSVNILQESYAMLQTAIFVAIMCAIAYINLQVAHNKPLIALPRKLSSTSSFDRRQKLAVATIATFSQFISAVFRLKDMAQGGLGYIGDASSPIFQNILSLSLIDMMIVVYLLAASLHLFEPPQLKMVLLAHMAALFASQVMLASDQGEMISKDTVQAGGVGNFVSIVVSILGAL